MTTGRCFVNIPQVPPCLSPRFVELADKREHLCRLAQYVPPYWLQRFKSARSAASPVCTARFTAPSTFNATSPVCSICQGARGARTGTERLWTLRWREMDSNFPVREHRAMAPTHGFAATSHREAALRGAPPPMARPRSEAQRRSVRPAAAMRSTHRENAVLRRCAGRPGGDRIRTSSTRARSIWWSPLLCCRKLGTGRCALSAFGQHDARNNRAQPFPAHPSRSVALR
jgi:hypothetical protein